MRLHDVPWVCADGEPQPESSEDGHTRSGADVHESVAGACRRKGGLACVERLGEDGDAWVQRKVQREVDVGGVPETRRRGEG